MQYLKSLLDQFAITGNVAEIGTFLGEGSTPILLEHVREHGGRFFAFDIFTDDEVYAKVQRQLPPPMAQAVKGFSVTSGRAFTDTLDFLFIDGDHGFPRISPSGEQSGVALDILAWHQHLNIGGVLAFHDYTGTPGRYGNPSLMAVEHAVDGLIREPAYEYIGSDNSSIRAFVKRKNDLLYPLHVIKKAPEAVRAAWGQLDRMEEVPPRVVIFGAGETSLQVLDAIRMLYGPDVHVLFTDSFCREPGEVWGCPKVPFRRELASDSLLVLGTIFEAQVAEFLTKAGVAPSHWFGFFEFIAWYHVGRFGYR